MRDKPGNDSARLKSYAESAAQDAAHAPPRGNIERIFKDYNGALLRFLRAKLHSPQEALDVAQEAYVQVLGLSDSKAVSFLQAYLFKTAENLANNRLRDAHRRRELDELAFFEVESAKSPEHSVGAGQNLELIAKTLQELPADVIRAFLLVKFDEMAPEQAAKVLGWRSQRVRRYVARAMAHILKALES